MRLAYAHTAEAKSSVRVESSETKEIERAAPIERVRKTKAGTEASGSSSASVMSSGSTAMITAESSTSLGPNLIANPSFETMDASGLPSGWSRGGYGVNTRVLTYPVAGNTGARAVRTEITSYTSGDAKWYFRDVPIEAGAQYQYSDFSLANTQSIIDVRYTMSDGSFRYTDLLVVPASASYQKNTVIFTVPAGAVSLTVFHLLNRVGSLSVDDIALQKIVASPPSSGNLITNGNFETAGANGLPAGWWKGGYGTNVATLTYPVSGVGGSKAAQVSISSYTSGDRKWYFTPVALTPGVYTYSDQYRSTVTSYLTAAIEMNDGTFRYVDIATLPAASVLTNASADFTVPVNAKKVTVFHLIKSVGTLVIDSASLVTRSTTEPSVFTTGAVTLRLDDGWRSQYQNALPKMNASGMKGTWYVVSDQMADDGFPGYMNVAEVKTVASGGHEIAAHTRTHRDLVTLTPSEQQAEIAGSRQDILSWNVGPVLSFAYPFGSYDASIITLVENAGFTNAAATIGGNVRAGDDPYQLARRGVTIDVTAAQIKGWIDAAIANKQWLILAFHQVLPSCVDFYCTTTATFNEVVDYIDQKNARVVTVSEGAAALQ